MAKIARNQNDAPSHREEKVVVVIAYGWRRYSGRFPHTSATCKVLEGETDVPPNGDIFMNNKRLSTPNADKLRATMHLALE